MKITEKMAKEYFEYRFVAILESRENTALVLASSSSLGICCVYSLLLVDGMLYHTESYVRESMRMHEYREQWNESFGKESEYLPIFTDAEEKAVTVCYFDKEKQSYEQTGVAPVAYNRTKDGPFWGMCNKRTGEIGFWRGTVTKSPFKIVFSLYVRKADGTLKLTLENVGLKEYLAYKESCKVD